VKPRPATAIGTGGDLAVAPSGLDGRRRLMPLLQRYGVWVALAVELVAAAVAVPQFASIGNLSNLLAAAAVIGVVALGQTFVIAAGGLDLSVGMLAGLVTVLTCGIMDGDAGLIPAVVALALVLGVGVGLLNGVLVAITRVHPMIVTFGMLSILKGCIFLYTNYSVGSVPPLFKSLDSGGIGPIPTSFLLLAGLTFASWAALRHTPFGRYVLAVGGSETNAHKAAIPVNRIKIAVYALSGLSAGIGGLILAARLGTGYSLAGQGLELDVIVAVVLGGTMFTGGRANMVGTVAGVFVLVILSNMLNLLEVAPYVQQVLKGAIVVGAISLYMARRADR
jgi:ribose/xylose/arabinose/galactoside ABC-type transport system permease subunit